jgi:hypothetical protein
VDLSEEGRRGMTDEQSQRSLSLANTISHMIQFYARAKRTVSGVHYDDGSTVEREAVQSYKLNRSTRHLSQSALSLG